MRSLPLVVSLAFVVALGGCVVRNLDAQRVDGGAADGGLTRDAGTSGGGTCRDAQDAYRYAGCPEPSSLDGWLGTMICAMSRIYEAEAASAANTCTRDDECTTVGESPAGANCHVSTCPAPLSLAAKAAYEAAVAAEFSRFCPVADNCRSGGGSCAARGPVRCVNNRCSFVDGGTSTGGATDGGTDGGRAFD